MAMLFPFPLRFISGLMYRIGRVPSTNSTPEHPIRRTIHRDNGMTNQLPFLVVVTRIETRQSGPIERLLTVSAHGHFSLSDHTVGRLAPCGLDRAVSPHDCESLAAGTESIGTSVVSDELARVGLCVDLCLRTLICGWCEHRHSLSFSVATLLDYLPVVVCHPR